MRRKLLDDVSISELMHLREEGYSNREIADCLDVSEMTIYNYIGKNPKEIVSRVRRETWLKKNDETFEGPKPIKLKAPAPEPPAQPQTAVLSVQGRTIDLEGVVCRYTIFAGKEPCRVMISKGEDSAIMIKLDDLQDFAAEVLRILQHKDAFAGGLEAW